MSHISKYFPFNLIFPRERKKRGYPGVFRRCGSCNGSFYVTSIELLFHAQQDSGGPMVCRLCRLDSGSPVPTPATFEKSESPSLTTLKI